MAWLHSYSQGYARLLNLLQSPLLLLMRLYWGWGFFQAGKGKFANIGNVTGFFTGLGLPYPMATAYTVGTFELVCGLCLLLGLFARVAALPLTVIMVVAFSTAHAADVISIEAFTKEEPFLFLLTCLLVLAFGPGKLSVDGLIRQRA